MLGVLLRKEFAALTAFLTQNRKTGERRKDSSIVWMFVLYGVLLVFIGFSVMVTFIGIADVLTTASLDWFYFALLALVAVLLGVVGSAFSTYTALYHAKDNEFLLSLPIKPSLLLTARMTGVYLTGLLFSAVVWIPGIIAYFLIAGFQVPTLLCSLVLFPFLGLIVLALSCLLGFLVALLAARMKNKTLFTMVFSVLFLGAYFWFFSQFSNVLFRFLEQAADFGAAVRSVYPLYVLGLAGTGDLVSLLVVIACACAVFGLLIWILSATYFKLLKKTGGTKSKSARKGRSERAASVSKALIKKEFRRFLASPAYMLNCGIGLVMILVLAVLALWKMPDIRAGLDAILPAMPAFVQNALGLLCAILPCMFAAMVYISAPSVSLEGKQIWILQSVPVEAKSVLRAKQSLHLILALPVIALATAALCVVVRLEPLTAALAVLTAAAFCRFISVFGLFWDLKSPNLSWTSEAVPVKQGLPVTLTLLLGWLVALILGGLGFALGIVLDMRVVLAVICVILAIASHFLGRWIDTRGARIFQTL